MTKEERRDRERELKREMILDTAEKLIFAEGFEQINFNDIAAASGYTRRSIYLYFKDRDDVFYHIVLRGQKLLLEYLKSAEETHLSGGNTVDTFCDAIFKLAKEYPEYFEMILLYELRKHDYSIKYSDTDDIKSACQNISVDYGEIVTKAVGRDIETGRLKSRLSAGQMMLVFWGQIFGFMQIIIQRSENFSDIYGIEREDLLLEFKNIIKKIF
ncbi:MAG: TetR/AcrR family transcriptional regulator [Spirochaetales bacterium]|nr:TetR/AcrR family transcriptional regulator [Spirochaetales bacterium]